MNSEVAVKIQIGRWVGEELSGVIVLGEEIYVYQQNCENSKSNTREVVFFFTSQGDSDFFLPDVKYA